MVGIMQNKGLNELETLMKEVPDEVLLANTSKNMLSKWFMARGLFTLGSRFKTALWVSTIKNLGVAKSSIFSALIPVAAALIAWILGHEILNERQWIGIAISTVGVVMSQYSGKANH